MANIFNLTLISHQADSIVCRSKNYHLFSILFLIILISINSLDGYAFSSSETKAGNFIASRASYPFAEIDNTAVQNSKPIPLVASPVLKISNLTKNCTPDNTHYTILFEISGGHPANYTVVDKSTGRKTGSLFGSFFVSDLIPSSKYYSFLIIDTNISDTVVAEGVHSCNQSSAKEIDLDSSKIKGIEQKTIQASGLSAPEKMSNKTAQVNIAKSNKGSGASTSKDEVSKRNYPPIKVNHISRNCAENNSNYSLLFEISGGNPSSYIVLDNSTGKATGSLFFNFFESDPIFSGSVYSYSIFDTNGSAKVLVEGSRDCGKRSTKIAGSGPGKITKKKQTPTQHPNFASPKKTTTTVSPEKYTKSGTLPFPTSGIKYSANWVRHVLKVRNISRNCTEDRANYILLFEISGGNASSYKVVDNSTGKETGSLFAGFFESKLIPSGVSYSYSIFDTDGSDTTLIEGDHSCGKPLKSIADIFREKRKDPKANKVRKKNKPAKTRGHNMNTNLDLFGDDPGYDELSIFIDVPTVGGGDIDVVIKDQDVYLPITDLFDFLKVKNVASPGLDTISGFFINQEAIFVIDRINNKIQYDGKVYELDPGDLIRTEWNLYLSGYLLGKIFGLDCFFNFRNMSVKVLTKLELPVIREMRLAELRQNLIRLKGETKADTTIKRRYPFFYLGMADWSINVTEQNKEPTSARLNLRLGSIIAGGEATANLNYNSQSEFTEKQQYYLWRRVNNNRKVLRQISAGKIVTNATASIFNPVVGVQFTNTPTTFRRSFGSYTLSDITEPGWVVELYVNNVMIDYAKADAAGFFSFEVPLVYGNSMIKLKFYGPWGEERTREQNITIPFSFIPVKKLEYTLSAGMV
ncbi:MAG: hypothetical protein U9R19_09625, partial [Bacteroidota bacterium]|nr:hypothetical protein [Bacteroidota bacterium]